jgi:tetratricopeptide (TPR) repeat protein
LTGAEEAFERAAQLTPLNAYALAQLGELRLSKGAFEEGFAALRRAIEIEPTNAGLRNTLSHVLTRHGELQAALAASREAIALDPQNSHYTGHLGNLLWQIGDLDGAEDALRRATLLPPTNAHAHAQLARLLAREDDEQALAAALAAAEQAVELEPGNYDFQELLKNLRTRKRKIQQKPAAPSVVVPVVPSIIVVGNSRIHLPKNLAASYLEDARRLRELGRLDEAEAVLREAIRCFPDLPDPLLDYARLAEARRESGEAAARWKAARILFPERWLCYVGEALGLCQNGQLDEGEALLREAMERFPDEPQPILDHARVALLRRDWDEAAIRWQKARSRFPERPITYLCEAWALRELGHRDEAEALLREAMDKFPTEAQPVVDYARVSEARGDWPEAAHRWEAARRKSPSDIAGFVGGATALRELRQFEQAENLLREAINDLPPNAQVWSLLADLATRRNDWPAALARWQEAQSRFPDQREFAHRILEARMRLIETGTATDGAAASEAAAPQGAAGPNTQSTAAEQAGAAMRELMLDFESLGGMLHGCEFGTVQREFGAEPLGLLRWSDIGPAELVTALEARFAGVGLPENTELFLADNAGRREYITKDTRFGMIMHTFIHEDTITHDKMFAQACRRLQFLAQKLVEDLAGSEKIFVYKYTLRPLTTAEVHSIYQAVRGYGKGTLLNVTKADDGHGTGSVEQIDDGLLILLSQKVARFSVSG